MRVIQAIAVLMLTASAAAAADMICNGDIVSIQGEGMVARKHRFEVSVTGRDVAEILEKCRKIALERQERAAKKSAAGRFRGISDLALDCMQDGNKLVVRRRLQTRP